MPKQFTKKDKILRKEKKQKLLGKVELLTAHDIILYGLKSPKATRLIESTNTLTFICTPKATKPQIRQAFEAIYGAKAKKVNTLNTFDGRKKAYVKCKEEGDAMEVAEKFNIL